MKNFKLSILAFLAALCCFAAFIAHQDTLHLALGSIMLFSGAGRLIKQLANKK